MYRLSNLGKCSDLHRFIYVTNILNEMKFTKLLEVILRKFYGKKPYFLTKHTNTFDPFPLKENGKEKWMNQNV